MEQVEKEMKDLESLALHSKIEETEEFQGRRIRKKDREKYEDLFYETMGVSPARYAEMSKELAVSASEMPNEQVEDGRIEIVNISDLTDNLAENTAKAFMNANDLITKL